MAEKRNNKSSNVQEKTFKFSWAQMFSNANGKTSASAAVGFIASMVCLALFCVLVAFYFFNVTESGTVLAILDKTITYFTVSAGLLGVRSITSTIADGNKIKIGGNDNDDEEDEKPKKRYSPRYDYSQNYSSPSSSQRFSDFVDAETNDATTGISSDGMETPDEE